VTDAPAPAARSGLRWRRRFAFAHEAALLALLAGLLAVARVLDPAFVSGEVQAELLTHVGETALLALPMTLIVLAGGIDLSVGATMALCAVVLGLAVEAAGAPIPVAVLLALLAGGAAGALNGLFVARVRVHPLIVTLATLAAFRGIAEGISGGRPISGFPAGFTALGQNNLAAALFLGGAALTALALARTPLGLWLAAIGHNEEASRFAGVPVDRIRLGLHALSGLVAAAAAVLFVARRNTAKADIGTGIELDVIAMVVLGGTSIFGGRGTIAGTVLGVLVIHETREFVSWHWNRDELNLVVLGALLILSVLLNRLFSRPPQAP
jgi:rhamnose transport system permease protein